MKAINILFLSEEKSYKIQAFNNMRRVMQMTQFIDNLNSIHYFGRSFHIFLDNLTYSLSSWEKKYLLPPQVFYNIKILFVPFVNLP